ncbi:hypothetical protein EXIGLDRAFT_846242 [Exidia glandulosa HHB12029]|uniref:F-box domain-containing protein n=1 Tax=Exidia glandulosa HHB12029 TaxID=1314781 RepID=A0A165B3H4_EXIGL|nr:hypothetical protein EXIGLDRAFT_846242 [Exidia glandulosa HHB12029]
MLSIACDLPPDRTMATLSEHSLLASVFALHIGPDEELHAYLPFLERCRSLRCLDLENPRPASTRLLSTPSAPSLTHLDVSFNSSSLAAYSDLLVLLGTLPALKSLWISCSVRLFVRFPDTLDEPTYPYTPLSLSLDEYRTDIFPGCHLPILASRKTLRNLYIWSPLSTAFAIPHVLNEDEDYSTVRAQAIIRQSGKLFEALLIVAPRLHTLYMNAQRTSQPPDNPEPSHLPHLMPLFLAFKELRSLRIVVQLDTDPEIDELGELLNIMPCPLHELNIYFIPLMGQIPGVSAAARILETPTATCLRVLRSMRIVLAVIPALNDIAAMQVAVRPFREFCIRRRITFRGPYIA